MVLVRFPTWFGSVWFVRAASGVVCGFGFGYVLKLFCDRSAVLPLDTRSERVDAWVGWGAWLVLRRLSCSPLSVYEQCWLGAWTLHQHLAVLLLVEI